MARRRYIYREQLPTPRSCGKNRYSSRAEAEMVAGQQELIHTNHNLKLKVYHCAYCGGWHLTRSV